MARDGPIEKVSAGEGVSPEDGLLGKQSPRQSTKAL